MMVMMITKLSSSSWSLSCSLSSLLLSAITVISRRIGVITISHNDIGRNLGFAVYTFCSIGRNLGFAVYTFCSDLSCTCMLT